MDIRSTLVTQPIGAGSALKAALDKRGIHQKKGCGCQTIQKLLDHITLVPSDLWDGLEPPHCPAGWNLDDQRGPWLLFKGPNQCWAIRERVDGRYKPFQGSAPAEQGDPEAAARARFAACR